jgi:cation diffusion facilitator family transporter
MTDVWTSVGVVAGVGAVALTGWKWLDPVIALLVAVNIVWSGVHLIWRSLLGLLDTALPKDESQKITAVLNHYQQQDGVNWHALRTRSAGPRRFVSVHLLVHDAWTVREGHDLAERVDQSIREALPAVTVFTHVEPVGDPASWDDISLDRAS